jgi:hypothetical protein
MNPENQARAERILCAAAAVEAYNENKDEPETIAADMLADLRHYCDAHGLDFADCDRRGQDHYTNEQEPQQ